MCEMTKRKLRKLVKALQSPELKAELDMRSTVICYVHPYLLGDASDAIPPIYNGVYDKVPYFKPKADK
jgi:hypothetical protein